MTHRDVPRVEPCPDDEEREGFLLATPYSEGFVADLKGGVPARDRAWDAHGKRWWCAAEHAETVFALLLEYFGAYELVDEDTGELTHIDRSGARAVQGGLF